VKVHEAIATLEKLSDADWKKMTEGEKWSVGVTAHHLASALEPVSAAIEAVVAGKSLEFTNDMLNVMNATHAREYANCTKAETIDLLKKGGPVADAVVRGLSDDHLAKSGTVFEDTPPMTVEQLVIACLITHIDEHFGSIRKTVIN
jgi:hypothetical protein